MGNNIVFTPKTMTLENIITEIDNGQIALPDLQRPFVWKDTKVRDLIDSLYKGLPIGAIILWEIYDPNMPKHAIRAININSSRIPRFLVIDGQQRLTSLYSILKNREIIANNFYKKKIKISFNPIEEKFEVFNAAIEKSPEWIDDISDILTSGSSYKKIQEYLGKIGEEYQEKHEEIASRIDRLTSIKSYPISVIELSSELDPEEVAEIFVRINSKGQSLTQSDFILTLLSVYWPEGRQQIEQFCNENRKKRNLINIVPQPEQLIRTIVGYAFNRGRLKYAYLALKGRDFENRIISEKLQEKNFELFKGAQSQTLHETNWNDYIKAIYSAGFINEKMITSKVAFFITYTFYLKGKYQYKIPNKELSRLIRKWFAFVQLTQRYTGSPESQIEQDLKSLEETGNLETFINRSISTVLTPDYWEITLPEILNNATKNYAFYVYLASLIFNDTYVLFSDIKIRDMLNPHINQKKKYLDLHHIYPQNYLKKQGYGKKEINQIANLIYLEYQDNIAISDKAPADYWPQLMQKVYGGEKEEIYKLYDLPFQFYKLTYEDFLEQRRLLMAHRIKEYFYSL